MVPVFGSYLSHFVKLAFAGNPQGDDALVPAVCPSSNWPLQEILRETMRWFLYVASWRT
jgi:hypothetical protein